MPSGCVDARRHRGHHPRVNQRRNQIGDHGRVDAVGQRLNLGERGAGLHHA